MPEETGGEKTLPASPTKRRRAREEGNVAKSHDLNAAWTLFMALMAMVFLGQYMLERLVLSGQFFLGELDWLRLEPDTAQALAANVVTHLAVCVLPVMVFLLIGGWLVNVVQVGFLFAPKMLIPKPERLNPISGMRKFFTLRTLTELVKSVLKLAIVLVVVWLTLRSRWDKLLTLMEQTPLGAIWGIAGLVFSVWWRIVVAMFVLGILDYGFQRWQYEKDLMMTVQEAREEAKELEGDPRIRQRIRQLQRQVAMQRMLAEVPRAEVVVTNPVTFAVALRYNAAEMQAPVVIAKGARRLAERIRDLATEHSVPLVEKPELARALYRGVDVGQPVPETLFRAVAEILAFVYQIDRRAEKLQERAAAAGGPLRAAG